MAGSKIDYIELDQMLRAGKPYREIAKRFNVSIRNLKKWNKLRRSRIYPGQRLKIYGSSAAVSISIAAKTQK